MRRGRRLGLAAAAVLLVASLIVPAPGPTAAAPGEATPFRWDADELFAALEVELTRVEGAPLQQAERELLALEREGDELLAALGTSAALPAIALARLATLQFELAVRGGAHPTLLPRVQDFLVRARTAVADAAPEWPRDRRTHEALYRVLFGGRMALDEALTQAGTSALAPLVHIEDVGSASPSIVVEGVRVHSGDILLSRGGAPTSALIARGNDFPNTFSHAALAHVDGETGVGTVVESLIETGSVLTTVEEYLQAKKHRVLVLRLRPDHPALRRDPLLPHHAAEEMIDRLRARHVDYDFSMDWEDASKAFCSEIIFHPYRARGVELWSFRSSVSAPGLVDWLAGMGVEHFTSLVPSDVEYDPQLRAVAEWRDTAALMDYRLDNAITDVLLEEAERGARLGYTWYALPVARLLKVYSIGQSLVGAQPTIPRGMSPEAALRVDALVSGVHPVLKQDLQTRVAAFRAERGYEPPYWVLVALARDTLDARRGALAPALAVP